VECRVILAHELVKLNVIVVLPPLFPIIILSTKVACGDRNVTNGCIEPYIEDLVLIALFWHGCTPFKVSCDASTMESISDELVCEPFGIITPLSLNRLLIDILLELWGCLGEIDVNMLGLDWNGSVATDGALWVNQFDCFNKLTTAIALVTSTILIATHVACSLNKSVCEESGLAIGAAGVLQLSYLLFVGVP